ncbi:DUF2214 domain-containing protein [Phyllobacterium sp. SYP-B3895]|uniref:DUF6644 family protein n=1 Tax=Phyllobacterium sp. SYP-B3895 TaxID=2663240 RepID=UPI00141C5299|nr:DUF2214 domain-containing protein [Phyllobacterium sp. SYP-B3895]
MNSVFVELLQGLSEWPVAVLLRRYQIAYLIANAVHIISVGLLIGAIVTLDLRVLGLFKQYPVNMLAPPLIRVAATGVALAMLTGLILFSVRPVAYINNPAFLAKLALIALGLGNALLLSRSRTWRFEKQVPGGARVAALISLTVWICAVIAGRWIGFI